MKSIKYTLSLTVLLCNSVFGLQAETWFGNLIRGYTWQKPAVQQSSQTQTREDKPVVAFDIHEVIVHQRALPLLIWGALKTISNAENRWALLRLAANPQFTRDVKQAIKEARQQGRGTLDVLLEKNELYQQLLGPHIDAIYTNIINQHTLDEKTATLIERLAEKGYPLYIASNIEPRSFKELLELFPHVFKHFKENRHFIPAYNTARGFARKPDSNFYRGLYNLMQQNGEQTDEWYFVDDQHKNIDGALNDDTQKDCPGLRAHHFTNPDNFESYLIDEGLL